MNWKHARHPGTYLRLGATGGLLQAAGDQMQTGYKISSTVAHQAAKPVALQTVARRTRRRAASTSTPWSPPLTATQSAQRPAPAQAEPPNNQGQTASGSDGSSTMAVTRAARIDTGDAIEELQVLGESLLQSMSHLALILSMQPL